MKHKLFGFLTINIALMFGAASIASAEQSSLIISSPDVIDGRTLEDDSGHVYRLHAVRAPSIDATCEDADGVTYHCGEQARRSLQNYASGMLKCRKGGFDTEGIQLIRCYDFANRDLGSLLVSAGWALPDRDVAQHYIFEELEAEAHKRGMWVGRFSVR